MKRRRHSRRRRGGVTAIMVNPRRSRLRRSRRRHFARRRNPGGFVGQLVGIAVPAALTAGAFAGIDAKLLGNMTPLVRGAIKLAVAGAVGLFLRRKYPALAGTIVGAVIATLVYEQVTKLAGGVAAPTSVDAAKQLKQLVLEDPRANRAAMGILIEEGPGMRGMGARLDDRLSLSGPIEQSANVLPPGGHYANVNLG